MVQNIIIGICCVVLGVLVVRLTFNHPTNESSAMGDFNRKLQGYLGGVGLIIIGIMLIVGKLHW